MTGVDTLYTLLERFDEEAFVALANRGLYRRAQKDLERTPVAIAESSEDALTVSVGEHRVRIDAGGPAKATCSCPAGGICQHVLSAAIHLKSSGRGVSSRHAGDDLRDALLAIPADALVKHAGKAGYRWAFEFVHDLADDAVTIDGEQHLRIALQRPRVTWRYLGGGIDALIADAELPQIAKHRVAAVLAFQRAHGRALTAPSGGEAAAIDDTSLDASRTRFRERATQLLTEAIELGLAHLSSGIHERIGTMAVWAQGVEYHRLARVLRRIADHIDLAIHRAGGADSARLLDEITLAFMLLAALDDAARRGQAPASLIGRARGGFDGAGELQLLGLGARPWRSAGGYLGLTMLFWSPATRTFLSCAQARPQRLHGFDPIARYRSAGPWQGLGAPAQVSGRRIALTGAQVGDAGRLSAAETTSVTLLPDADGDWTPEQLKPWTDWHALAARQAGAARSLLEPPVPMHDWAFLRPAAFGRASFDPATQTISWPLLDDGGSMLLAQLRYDRYTAHAIRRIETRSEGPNAEGSILVAQARPGPGGLSVEPLSLVTPLAEGSARLDALFFDGASTEGAATSGTSPDGVSLRSDETDDAMPREAIRARPGPLIETRHPLLQQAERGLVADQVAAWQHTRRDLVGRAHRAGLTAFDAVEAETCPPAAALLRLNAVAMQYEAMLGSVAEPIG